MTGIDCIYNMQQKNVHICRYIVLYVCMGVTWSQYEKLTSPWPGSFLLDFSDSIAGGWTVVSQDNLTIRNFTVKLSTPESKWISELGSLFSVLILSYVLLFAQRWHSYTLYHLMCTDPLKQKATASCYGHQFGHSTCLGQWWEASGEC